MALPVKKVPDPWQSIHIPSWTGPNDILLSGQQMAVCGALKYLITRDIFHSADL